MSLYRYVPGQGGAARPDARAGQRARRGRARSATTGARRWRRWAAACGRLYTTHTWLPLVDQTRPLLGPNALRGMDIAARRARRASGSPARSRSRSSPPSSRSRSAPPATTTVRRSPSRRRASATRSSGPPRSRCSRRPCSPATTRTSPPSTWTPSTMGGEEFMEFGLTLLLDGIAVARRGTCREGLTRASYACRAPDAALEGAPWRSARSDCSATRSCAAGRSRSSTSTRSCAPWSPTSPTPCSTRPVPAWPRRRSGSGSGSSPGTSRARSATWSTRRSSSPRRSRTASRAACRCPS